MSITDELRKYIGRYDKADGTLLAIADRIDAEHAKARGKAYNEGVWDGIDADKDGAEIGGRVMGYFICGAWVGATVAVIALTLLISGGGR